MGRPRRQLPGSLFPLVRERVPPLGESALLLLENKKRQPGKGLIVIRYYLALQGAENGVTAMVTPFFCVQG